MRLNRENNEIVTLGPNKVSVSPSLFQPVSANTHEDRYILGFNRINFPTKALVAR